MSHQRLCLPLLAAASLAVLVGCASPTPYHPQTEPGSTGYSDQQLAGNRYRITFTGNSATRRSTVEDYLLLRAAEVTLKAGNHYFEFDTRDTKAKTTYHTDFEGWPGWPGYGGWYWHSWAFGPEQSADTIAVTRYEAYAEIIVLTDEQAKSEARAINAQEVLDHIGPEVKPKT